MYKFGITVCLILCIATCTTTSSEIEELRKEAYDQLILNLVMSNPYSGKPKVVLENKEDILRIARSITDDTLGLTLNLHSWTNYGGDFPKNIVFVSHKNGFQYAFPFYDEMHYQRDFDRAREEQAAYFLSKNLTFEEHVNFIAEQLNHDFKNQDRLLRFVALLADSLLHMHPLKNAFDENHQPIPSDSIFNNIKRALEDHGFNGREECRQNYASQIEQLRMESQQENILIYFNQQGVGAFWKFEIQTTIFPPNLNAKEKHRETNIKVTFENRECYSNFLI